MYQGYKEEDPTIQHFWTVMEEWGHKERSKFIQFAWGRQRLPRPGTWGRKMLLQNQHRYDSFFHVVIPLQICLTSLSQLFHELLVFFFLFPFFLFPFFLFFLSFFRMATHSEKEMPMAHTCFFHVELPPYSTLELTRKMLALTIKYGLGTMMSV